MKKAASAKALYDETKNLMEHLKRSMNECNSIMTSFNFDKLRSINHLYQTRAAIIDVIDILKRYNPPSELNRFFINNDNKIIGDEDEEEIL